MFILQCSKCKNKMKYQSRDIILTGKKKKCVYCGKHMLVNNAIIKDIK